MTQALKEITAMQIETTRFGTIEVEQGQMIHFPEGMLGFESANDFCIFNHAEGSPFIWMQSINEPDLAFVLVVPFDFFPEYDFDISQSDIDTIKLEDVAEVAVFTVVTISDGNVTANLSGPIIMNSKNRHGKQIVLSNPTYKTRHSLVQQG